MNLKSMTITFCTQLRLMAQHFSNKQPILEVFKSFHTFSSLFGLNPNFTKCKVAGIDLLKGVKMVVCGKENC